MYVIIMHTLFYYLVTGRCPFDSDVKCNDTGKCVESKVVCDSEISCKYETDEENCGKEY